LEDGSREGVEFFEGEAAFAAEAVGLVEDSGDLSLFVERWQREIKGKAALDA